MPVAGDPYALTPDKVREPPASLLGQLAYCGPGFVLSASIVGSGELIATTTLGAKAGFIVLWVIILSCVVKVALQLEFGRHTILSGRTPLESINRLPGPKPAGAHWTIWGWFLLQPLKIAQMAGIVGAVALVLNLVLPQVSVPVWCWASAGVVGLLVSLERYRMIERSSLALLVLFTLLTLTSVVALQWTEYAISGSQVLSGLSFQLPAAATVVVFAAFGLTGVGGDEIIQYGYWLLEKGYAAYAGPREETDAWRDRARGWIRVMTLDALASMVAYTVVTVAFFLLGAAVLHSQQKVPEGNALIESLAHMYTDTLGAWAHWLFLLGAFVVLFSTLFSAMAAWTRMYADAFAQVGMINFRDQAERRRTVFWLAWAFALLWAGIYLFFEKPVWMVALGGVATAAILLLVVFAAIVFRYRSADPAMLPSKRYDVALWCSIVAIVSFVVYGLCDLASKNL